MTTEKQSNSRKKYWLQSRLKGALSVFVLYNFTTKEERSLADRIANDIRKLIKMTENKKEVSP